MTIQNKIIIAFLVVVNLVLIGLLMYFINEHGKRVNEVNYLSNMSIYRYWDQAHAMRSHFEDSKEGNAWYFKELYDQPKYLGRSWLIRDRNGIKVISEYDIQNI
jgi:hypothetical protein